jgi:hypothetical protein
MREGRASKAQKNAPSDHMCLPLPRIRLPPIPVPFVLQASRDEEEEEEESGEPKSDCLASGSLALLLFPLLLLDALGAQVNVMFMAFHRCAPSLAPFGPFWSRYSHAHVRQTLRIACCVACTRASISAHREREAKGLTPSFVYKAAQAALKFCTPICRSCFK